jgi:uncharacterized protein (DUF1499 family)
MRIQNMRARSALSAVIAVFSMTWTASAATAGYFSVATQELRPCPALFNCVSSLGDPASRHRVDSFRIAAGGIGQEGPIPAEQAWEFAKRALENIPGTKIMESSPRVLRAEVRSRWFGFPDDVELVLSPVARRIHVRSASRRFPADFGANRRRVEAMRLYLRRVGVIE